VGGHPCGICARSRDFDGSARTPPFRAKLARHPLLRPEHPLQQGRHIQIGVELRPMQPQASRADLNLGQRVCIRTSQPFRKPRRKRQLDARVELDDDARAMPVIVL
jgi:hypothetical protein